MTRKCGVKPFKTHITYHLLKQNMLFATVIILLTSSTTNSDAMDTFRRFKYSRSVDLVPVAVENPCPSIFDYQTDENGNLIGTVRVDQTDPDGRVQLDIELSVGNSVQDFNGKITLAEDRQKVINDIKNRKPIYYRVIFPVWQNIPPRVTKISVNGNAICTGDPIPIQVVSVLTMIKLQHKLSLDVTPLISSGNSASENSNSFAPKGDENLMFDVRDDDSRPAGQPQIASNPFLNTKNPYNFNPPPPRLGPPPPGGGSRAPPPGGWHPPPPDGERRPPPPDDQRPPPPPREPAVQINPQNPFLNGLSTPEPQTGSVSLDSSNKNPFFDRRTERPSVTPQRTSAPSRVGATEAPPINGNVNEICGRPITTNSLIVNGQSVPRGAYPWLVAIFRQLENLSLSYICSGSIISERHVVTAAHCVKLEYRRVKPSEIVCVFGKLNIRKWVTAPGERMLEPDSITIHPDYEAGKANADIAVMTFPDPIPFSKTIMPLCLWQGNSDLNQVVGDIGTVVGWGRDENGDVSTAEPRQVSMPIVDQLECLKGSSPSTGQALVEIVSKNTFCAGHRNGSGPCNGDSGSAFLLRKNGVFYLRGIVSTALSEATHRTCNLQEYVVFTDASKYLDWLLSVMKQK